MLGLLQRHDLAERALTTRTDDGDQAGPLCALLGMASVEQREARGGWKWARPGPWRLSLGAGLSGPAVGVDVGPGRFHRGHMGSWSKDRKGGGLDH